MGSNITAFGSASFLLDVIPVAVIIILVAAFLYKRHKMRNAERKLTEEIAAFDHAFEERREKKENPIL